MEFMGAMGEVKEGYNKGLLEMKSLLCVLSRTGQEGIHLFIEKKNTLFSY